MPEIIVYAVEGRSADAKKALMADITAAVVKNFAVRLKTSWSRSSSHRATASRAVASPSASAN